MLIISIIQGAPGSGKSTFIERLGLDYILSDDHNTPNSKLAVLCIDPSSNVSGGSILGDKTRMTELARHERAFVRPSPNSGKLGGVNCHTADAVIACQAAGYDWTMVETVGLGQSEVEIDHVCDMVVLLLSPGAGDDLQGVKKGIMEIADMIVVNKADGKFVDSARHTASDYRNAVRFVRQKYDDWSPPVLMASAHSCEGIVEVWNMIHQFEKVVRGNGELEKKRMSQGSYWMWRHMEELIKVKIKNNENLAKKETELSQLLRNGNISPRSAASTLLTSIFVDIDDKPKK